MKTSGDAVNNVAALLEEITMIFTGVHWTIFTPDLAIADQLALLCKYQLLRMPTLYCHACLTIITYYFLRNFKIFRKNVLRSLKDEFLNFDS